MLRRRSSIRSTPQFARRIVDQPLDQIDRLRPAGAAIGRRRVGVGQHGDDVDVGGRDSVDARPRCRSCRTATATAGPSRHRRRCWPACAAAAPTNLSSSSSASSISPTLSRPCSSARITSERSQVHLTGRRACAPPTGSGGARHTASPWCRSRRRRRGTITRILLSGTLKTFCASMLRTRWGYFTSA